MVQAIEVLRVAIRATPSPLRQRAVYWTGRLPLPAPAMVTAKIKPSARVLVPYDDPAMRLLYLTGAYEPDVQAAARRLLRPGDQAIDIGANLGVHTMLFAALVGERGHVTAIEAVKRSADQIRRSVDLNGWADRVTVLEAVLADSAGPVILHVTPGVSTTTSLNADHPWLQAATPVDMIATTLDELVSPRPIRLLKIDVEGAEALVLRGAMRWLRDAPPEWIVCEVIAANDNGHVAILLAAGYQLFELSGAPLADIEAALAGRDITNVLCGWSSPSDAWP